MSHTTFSLAVTTVLANGVTLAGHVLVGDWAVIGAFSGVHQFCRVGGHCMIGGYSVVTKDVLPFSTTVNPRDIKVFGANGRDWSGEARELHNRRFADRLSPVNARQVEHNTSLERIRAEVPPSAELEELIAFLTSSERGFIK